MYLTQYKLDYIIKTNKNLAFLFLLTQINKEIDDFCFIWKEAMNKSGHVRLFVTRIMQEFESDTFLPEIDLERYKLLPE